MGFLLSAFHDLPDMTDRGPFAGCWPVVTAAEMQAFERRCFALPDVDERVVMESAGRSVAEAILRFAPTGRVAIAVGSGNNGGDGLVAARTLAAQGREVVLVPVGKSFDEGLLHGWDLPVAEAGPSEFAEASVIVDGLLGTGASGAPRGPFGEAVRAINSASAFVVAVDGPTGVDLSAGSVDAAAVRADLTVTFGALKRGHVFYPGRRFAGRILLAEVGFPPLQTEEASARLLSDAWAHRRLPPVPTDAHKGEMGIVGIVAGRKGMAGAALMSAMGALRAGAGGVRIFSDPANRVIVQTAIPEAIFHERTVEELESHLSGLDALVVGPGMGVDEGAGEILRRVLAAPVPAVIDADALSLLARGSVEAARLGHCVLTPHPGELARLAEKETAEVLADRIGVARDVARRWSTTVLAKGAPSLVVRDDQAALISVTGHSGVATGGMGDTLSGVCGAMLARGVAPELAAGLALHYAGRAAERAGRGRGLLPRDVAEALPDALLESPEIAAEPPFLLDLHPPR